MTIAFTQTERRYCPPITGNRIPVEPEGIGSLPPELDISRLRWVLMTGVEPERIKSGEFKVPISHGRVNHIIQAFGFKQDIDVTYVLMKLYSFVQMGPCGRTTHTIAVGLDGLTAYWCPFSTELEHWDAHHFYMRSD